MPRRSKVSTDALEACGTASLRVKYTGHRQNGIAQYLDCLLELLEGCMGVRLGARTSFDFVADDSVNVGLADVRFCHVAAHRMPEAMEVQVLPEPHPVRVGQR